MSELFHVNLYSVTKAYGGPEEGGWFYDEGEFLTSGGVYDCRIKANECADSILANPEIWYSKRNNKYHMGYGEHDGASPDGEADDRYLLKGGKWGDSRLRVTIENKEGSNYPKERPIYE